MLLLSSGSASAVEQLGRPTVFTGYGFDACSAPSLGKLEAWGASPYRALGIYIGGTNRACSQPNLTPVWVSSALSMGWSLLPLYVGLQAPCVTQAKLDRISGTPATALAQGKAAADDAAAHAAVLGLPAGSPVYADVEGYKLGNATCTKAVQSFVAGWVQELHARGLVAGLYGSAASTIRDVSAVTDNLPDAVWIANWNGVEGVFGDPYVSNGLWVNHQRIHQYKGGHNETYGGVKINIDSNYVDSTVVGGSGTPTPPPPTPPTVPAGTVTAVDGSASVSWPAEAFATQVVVTLTVSGAPPAPATYAVQLAATESDNQAPIDAFGAGVTLHLLRPVAGSVPAFSPDGATWQALPRLTSAGLSTTVPSAYTVDPDGTVEIETLVPGLFGLVPDTRPPSRPLVGGRMLNGSLSLTWTPATDDVAVAAYNVLRNGSTVTSVPATARSARVRGFSAAAPTVYRIQAVDDAGNAGQPSTAIVVVAHKRPAGLPKAVPQWAYSLYAWQHAGGGKRPAKAPKRPPAWYWNWAAWRSAPFVLR